MNVRRSLLLASAASNGAALIGFASSMILARLLIPSEVGVFSIAAALIGLVGSLRDFGVSAYLIRSPQLDRAKIAASYGVMIVVSWTLALLIALASPLAAMLYRDPRVGDLMLILALNLMLVPFGALTMAYLTREMQFGAQFVLNISSAMANAGIAVALAWQGYGAYSLAWAGLGSTLVTILVSLFYRPAWWPLLPTLKGWREVVSFGAPVTGGAVIGNLNNASVDLITGQMIGPEAVALYGKALSIRSLFEQFFMAAIRLVALPHFATLARYNVWATQRLCAHVDALSDDEYRRDAGLFFKSVHGTLNHLLVAEHLLWFRRFAEDASPALALNAEVETDRARLREHLLKGALSWLPLLEVWPVERLQGALSYQRMNGEAVTLPFSATLMHVFNHGIHHRGQISAALTALGQPAPELDMVFMLQEEAAA